VGHGAAETMYSTLRGDAARQRPQTQETVKPENKCENCTLTPVALKNGDKPSALNYGY